MNLGLLEEEQNELRRSDFVKVSPYDFMRFSTLQAWAKENQEAWYIIIKDYNYLKFLRPAFTMIKGEHTYGLLHTDIYFKIEPYSCLMDRNYGSRFETKTTSLYRIFHCLEPVPKEEILNSPEDWIVGLGNLRKGQPIEVIDKVFHHNMITSLPLYCNTIEIPDFDLKFKLYHRMSL